MRNGSSCSHVTGRFVLFQQRVLVRRLRGVARDGGTALPRGEPSLPSGAAEAAALCAQPPALRVLPRELRVSQQEEETHCRAAEAIPVPLLSSAGGRALQRSPAPEGRARRYTRPRLSGKSRRISLQKGGRAEEAEDVPSALLCERLKPVPLRRSVCCKAET